MHNSVQSVHCSVQGGITQFILQSSVALQTIIEAFSPLRSCVVVGIDILRVCSAQHLLVLFKGIQQLDSGSILCIGLTVFVKLAIQLCLGSVLEDQCIQIPHCLICIAPQTSSGRRNSLTLMLSTKNVVLVNSSCSWKAEWAFVRSHSTTVRILHHTVLNSDAVNILIRL